MANKYKYSRTIVIGHKDDGTPIRKYIQDNNKARFEAKVRAVQMLVARGGTPGKVTVEQWAWQWYHTYKEPHVGESQRNQLRGAPEAAHLSGDWFSGTGQCEAVPAARNDEQRKDQ